MKYDDLFIEKALPETLKNKELMDYFEKMHHGDKKAREIIINHNIRLVLNQIFKNFINTPYEKKDLFSMGLIGLIKGVDTFDASRNIKFSTYASICINNAIKIYMRKEKKYINTQSLDIPVCNDNEENDLTIEETLSDDSDLVLDYEKNEIIQIVRELVENLEAQEKEIIKLYFGFYDDKKYTQKEIAEMFNISKSNVANIIQKSLKKISIQLQQQGIIEKKLRKLILLIR